MKKLRKIVSFFVTACIAVGTLATSVSAEDSFEPLTFNTLDEYIEYSIPWHLYAQQMETSEILEYSNPIALYDFANNTVVGSEIFLIDNGQLIGKMDVYDDNGSYSSCFDTNITEDISNAYFNNNEIAIGGYDKSVLLYTDEKGFTLVDGLENDNAPTNIPTELNKIIIAGNVSTDFVMPYSIATYSLNVSHVDNSNTYDSGGQCWAAAVAMKLNYHKSLNLTADLVYENLTSAGINFSTNGTDKELMHYGYSDYIWNNSALSSGDVTTALMNKKPIIIHISTSNGITHAVVISGIILDVSSSTYTICDPNYKSTRTFNMKTNPNVVNTSISYPSVGYNFTTWYYTYY